MEQYPLKKNIAYLSMG